MAMRKYADFHKFLLAKIKQQWWGVCVKYLCLRYVKYSMEKLGMMPGLCIHVSPAFIKTWSRYIPTNSASYRSTTVSNSYQSRTFTQSSQLEVKMQVTHSYQKTSNRTAELSLPGYRKWTELCASWISTWTMRSILSKASKFDLQGRRQLRPIAAVC